MRLPPDIVEQLSDFKAWSGTGAQSGEVTLLDYVGFTATPDALFGFAALFQPDLVVHEEHHFLASGFSVKTFDGWRANGFALRDVQRVMNHLHVAALLQNSEVSDRLAVEAARVIADIWKRTLGPEGLDVAYFGTTLHDAAVTFYRRGDASADE